MRRAAGIVAGMVVTGAVLVAPVVAQVPVAPGLISPAQLAGLQESGRECGDARPCLPPVLLDVRASWVSYLQNHLAGAAWLNIETLRSQSGRLPFQLLPAQHYVDLFRRFGIDRDTRVVVYSAGDQLDIDATFAAWLLLSAGVRQVWVLDGGYARWELESRPLTQQYPLGRGAQGARLRRQQFQPATATLAEVQAASTGNGVLLVDARPADQYNGSAGAQLRRGHIPGAINHPWKDDLEKPDLALVWKPVDTLRADYARQGITPDRDIIVYCNSSTEASHLFFALKVLLGYPRVRIYTGAWSEWAERVELPIEGGGGRQ